MAMTNQVVEWGAASQIHHGEDQSGDQYVVKPLAGSRYLIAAMDGLGHGPEAAVASHIAVGVLEENPDQPLESLMLACHKALGNTRGVVMTLALMDAAEAHLTWVG